MSNRDKVFWSHIFVAALVWITSANQFYAQSQGLDYDNILSSLNWQKHQIQVLISESSNLSESTLCPRIPVARGRRLKIVLSSVRIRPWVLYNLICSHSPIWQRRRSQEPKVVSSNLTGSTLTASTERSTVYLTDNTLGGNNVRYRYQHNNSGPYRFAACCSQKQQFQSLSDFVRHILGTPFGICCSRTS